MNDATVPEEGTPDDAVKWDKKWDKWYWTQRAETKKDLDSGSDSLDKSMLTLSSGTLGVSLAFIKDIVPLGQAIWIPLLKASWIVLAACILTTVFSFQFSINALKERLSLLDEIYRTKNHELEKNQSSGWNTAVVACTYTAQFLFVVGLACTIIFVITNVSGFHSERTAKGPDAATVTNVRNLYMSGEGTTVEKTARPQGVEKGRQPMTLAPPPKAPAAPAPCPAKK